MEKLIKRLRRCEQFRCRECEYENVLGCRAKLNSEAADAIEVLQKDLERSKDFEAFWQKEAEEALRKFQVAIAQKPHWIPVTERLPERGYYVLVYEDGDILMASYADGNWVLRDMYEVIDDLKPTHWMPLPAAPRKGGA